MKLWSLTEERVAALRALLAEKEAELEELRNTTPEQMWTRDLDEVEQALDDMDDLMAADAEDEEKTRRKAQGKKGKKGGAAGRKAPKKKKVYDSDEESESDEDDFMDESDEEYVTQRPTLNLNPDPDLDPYSVPNFDCVSSAALTTTPPATRAGTWPSRPSGPPSPRPPRSQPPSQPPSRPR